MKIRKIWHKIKYAVLGFFYNKSLIYKFMMIFLFCIIVPVTVSCIVISHNENKRLYEREMENLNFIVNNEITEIKNVFDDVVAVSNVIAADSLLTEAGVRNFESEADYYDFLVDNNLKDYYSSYISQKPGVDDVKVYLKNDTVLNGGIIWKLTDEETESEWYKQAENEDGNMILCTENGVKTAGSYTEQSFRTDRLSFVRRIYRGYTGKNVTGYVKISLNMSMLREIMTRDADYLSFYFVNREEGRMYSPKENRFFANTDSLDKLIADKGNIALESGFGKTGYLENWAVVGVYNRSRIAHQQFENILTVILFNLLMALFMMGIVYVVYRSYKDRISKLIVSMESVESGVFKCVEGIAGRDEIGMLVNTFNHMIDKINVLINDVYKLEMKNKSIEVEKVRAQLKYLQSQVDPHFIFNVLNAMLVVSVKNGYTELTTQISCLAKMIRRLLDWSDDSEPLSNELGFVEMYLSLEKFRFRDNFDYEIEVKNNADECSIPKMIVQPLVENACHHGLQSKADKRLLRVSAELEDDMLKISVRDNGKGIASDKLREIRDGLGKEEFKGHIGVKNVYRRLKLYYGENADMQILSEENKGTEIIITIDYGERSE